MSKRREWNNGICKKTGRPWIFIRYFDFRGPSLTSSDRVYTDGLGNLLYIDTFSKINNEYDAGRTPEIEAREQAFREQDRLDLENRTGPYAPSKFDIWWEYQWDRWDKFWEPRKKWEWPIRLSLVAVILALNPVVKSCKRHASEQRQREQHSRSHLNH